jgi:hypothetical protein
LSKRSCRSEASRLQGKSPPVVINAASAQLNSQGNGGYTVNGTIIVRTALLEANGALNLTYDPNQNYSPPGGSGLTR